MKAFHFLRADMTAGRGAEPAWNVGEKRTMPRGSRIELCESGYHSCPTLLDCLEYAPGPVACVVEVSKPVEKGKDKYVSRSRTLLTAFNAERELRLFAADCAERALLRESEQGREPDRRSWAAIEVARLYAEGKAPEGELAAARAAAWAARAARAAAWAAEIAAWAAAEAALGAAWSAAWSAAEAAARAAEAATRAAWDAARAAERQWQSARLEEYLLPKLELSDV